MKFLSWFVLSLSVLTFTVGAVGANESYVAEKGSFVTLTQSDGHEFRAFVAGPVDANAAVLIVHDYFGISDATKQSVQRLGALGYRSVAVDLYGGKSATSHEDAVKLMQSLDRKATTKILQAGLDYLKRPGRKLATIGFSMGGLESLHANLNDPKAVSASVIIYGFGFDKIDTKQLEKLESPVLVIAGSEDTGATQAAINFLSTMREVKRLCEMFVYPGADHGYAQPLFNEGKNYNPEAIRTTWVLVEDFLASHLKF
ncbi:MAG TPA: dienelactone hydrolase family protein [Candidatus Acidoferrum sp.]|jgi:carboxymethylenebutenolidase